MEILKYILFLFINTLLFSQNSRYIYEVNYKIDSTTSVITKDYYHLDIEPDEINYYNRLFFINDSIFAKKKSYGFDGYKLSSFVTKKTKEKFYHQYEYIGDVNFYELKDEVIQNWKIGDSVKTINGFVVQNATLEYGGRNWIAWFCKEIPFPYGPYKFNGLPGLIMELYDTKKNYYFSVVKSENNFPKYKRVSLENALYNTIPTNQNKLNKLKLELYNNPFKYVFDGKLPISEGKKLQLEDGTILTKEELKPAETKERAKIRSFNNPIELNKAVKYPSSIK